MTVVTAVSPSVPTGVVSGAVAHERTLPVLAAFAPLLTGIQRGSVVACTGAAGVSLALSVTAGPSQAGSWVGIAGLPGLGLAAAAEMGVALERVVQVVEPREAKAAWSDGQWGDLLAALVDGFDVVLLGPGARRVRPGVARRVVARLQARGAVLVVVDAPVFGGDLRLAATDLAWEGLGDGHGVARSRRVTVCLEGRRVPRPRHAELWLPAQDGRPLPLDAAVLPLRRTG
jgi:hypothetical protein